MRSHAVVLALTGALLAGGCGSEDKGPTRAEYLAAADRICRDFDRKLGALSEPKDLAEVVGFAERAAPISRDGIAQLDRLDPPAELRDGARKMIAGLEEGTKLLDDLAAAGKAQDLDRVRDIGKRAEKRAGELQREARNAGFKDCGIDDAS